LSKTCLKLAVPRFEERPVEPISHP
jgi:hypothetical protein